MTSYPKMKCRILSFGLFLKAHHIMEEVEEDKGLHPVEEVDVDSHLVEEEEENKDPWLSHPTTTILTIPLLKHILCLVLPPTMLLPPMTTKMESMVMVLPPMIWLHLPILADEHTHLALLWMLLVKFA